MSVSSMFKLFPFATVILASCAPDIENTAPQAAPTALEQQAADDRLDGGAPQTSSWRIETPPGPDGINDFFDCVREAGATLVAAHRGIADGASLENSIEAIEKSLAAAPALVEIDVTTSADGVLYLMHDETLDRTTTGTGPATDLAWSEIAALRLRDADGQPTGARPPRFDETLARFKDRTILQIDFKRAARFEDVIAEVRRQSAEHRVVYIAYTLAQASLLHRLAPETMISVSVRSEEEFDRALAAGVPVNRMVAFTGAEAPAPRLNRALADRGVEVIFGTLGRSGIDVEIEKTGDEARYGQIAATGVNVISTDRTAAAHAALAEAGRALNDGECGVRRG